MKTIRKNATDKRTPPTVVLSGQDKALGLSAKGAALLLGLPPSFSLANRTVALIAGRLFECTSAVDLDFIEKARKDIAYPVGQYMKDHNLSVKELANQLGESITLIDSLGEDSAFLLSGKLFTLVKVSRSWDVKPVRDVINIFTSGDPIGRITRFGHLTRKPQQQISRWADEKRNFTFMAGDVYMRRTQTNADMGEPVKAIPIDEFINSHYGHEKSPNAAFAAALGTTMVQVRRYLSGGHLWCMDKNHKGDVFSNQSKFLSKGVLLDLSRHNIIYLD